MRVHPTSQARERPGQPMKRLLLRHAVSTHRGLLHRELRGVEEGVRALVSAQGDPQRSSVTATTRRHRTGMGNRNLTLRRSPHGNKTHRDIFVPSRWDATRRRDITGLPAQARDHVHDRVRAQALHTLSSRRCRTS